MPGLQPGQATRAGRAEYHLQSYNDLSAEHPVRQATIGPGFLSDIDEYNPATIGPPTSLVGGRLVAAQAQSLLKLYVWDNLMCYLLMPVPLQAAVAARPCTGYKSTTLNLVVI